MQAAEEGGDNKRNTGFEERDLEKEISKLRGRWELASILNFLEVRDLYFKFIGLKLFQ